MRRISPAVSPAWPPGYPPHTPVSAAISRALDREATVTHGIPSLVLMEHASAGIAAVASVLARPQDRVVVLCGPGNNGGDGYGAARFLASWGHSVRLVRCARTAPSEGDAGNEARWAAGALPIADAWSEPEGLAEALSDADVVVDALFGIGLDRDLEAPFPEWIDAINATDALRLAVDVPSGLDSDGGTACPIAVRADVTATMALPKLGLATAEGSAYAGFVVEIDIGLPGALHKPYLLDRE